jgi:hypothetical protein
MLRASYGCTVEDAHDEWPAAGFALLRELEVARGRVALIAATTSTDAANLVERLRNDLGVEVVSLGRALADHPQPPSVFDVESACGDATVLTDLDVLLWPEMNIAPLQLLAARSRTRPAIAVWPGRISYERATYSAPGRPDHHDIPLHDTVVLRPRASRFPDEVPFTIERIP